MKPNNKRATFSKRIKREILLEIADGKTPDEVLLKYAPEVIKNNTQDRKYAAKMIHKWKKEMYGNKEMLHILNHKVDKEMLEKEIKSIIVDDDEDILTAD